MADEFATRTLPVVDAIIAAAAAVARVQAWLADEREAGRCVLELQDAWIARLLEAAGATSNRSMTIK